MPRKYEMSWEGEPHYRWAKMYKRTRFKVTCADLKLPRSAWTQEGSYQAANEWWHKKRAEIDLQRAAEHPHAETLADLRQKLEYVERHGLTAEATDLSEQIETVNALLPDAPVPRLSPDTLRRIEAAEALGIVIPEGLDAQALQLLFGEDGIWAERNRQERVAPVDRTIGALGKKWAADRADEARNGVRSADDADNLRIRLDHFVRFAGASTSVDSINYDMWHRWYNHCAGMLAKRHESATEGWSADYARKVFSITKTFVKWLYQSETIQTLPRNFDDKRHRFERPELEIITFTNEEIKLLLDNATGQHRLHLMLMLNCGMTQKDISDLRKSQIDLDKGTITRRRSKTERKQNTPKVCYPLWPETIKLLRQHLSDDPVYALLTTKSKRRWVRKEMQTNGRLKKADNVATLFMNLRRKVNLVGKGKSLKVFRKTSATRLKGNKEYRDLRHYFLGHGAKTVADRNYAAESQALMDEAIKWLGQQYELV